MILGLAGTSFGGRGGCIGRAGRSFRTFSMVSPLRWVVLSFLTPTVSFPTSGADDQALSELQATGEQSTAW